MTDTIGEFEKKVKSDQNKYNKKRKRGWYNGRTTR